MRDDGHTPGARVRNVAHRSLGYHAPSTMRDRPYPVAMSPETPEGRERIARLEGQIEDVERQVERNERTFGPLPLAVERLQWTIDAINTRLDKRDREDDERFKKFERSVGNQFAACSTEIAKVADGQRELQESERLRAKREEERAKREEREEAAQYQSKTAKFAAKYGLIGTLGAATIAAGTAIFNALTS